MNKKKWALLVFILLISWGYYFLFYSKIKIHTVPASADMVISVNTKKLIRTYVWDFITHPSKWKVSSNSDTTSRVAIKDIFELPDYLLAFHKKNEALNVWYSVLNIKNDDDFNKGLKQFGFVKTGDNIFVSTEKNCSIQKNGSQILFCSAIVDSSLNVKVTAIELFKNKTFLSSDKLQKLKDANSHVAFLNMANSFLQEDAITKVNISESSIKLQSSILPKSNFTFAENNFSFNPQSILSFGFTQPNSNVLNLLSTTEKVNTSNAIGFNIDSFLLSSNKFYQLDFQNIQPRVDSAISYEFDDDFNKVEKVVVNKVDEPVFNFVIKGDSVSNVFQQWLSTNTITKTALGYYFRPMPFVKSYVDLLPQGELVIAPKNYLNKTTLENSKSILFLNLNCSKIEAPYLKYLPTDIGIVLKKLDFVKISMSKENNNISIQLDAEKNSSVKSLLEL